MGRSPERSTARSPVLMVIEAARLLRDGEVVLVGIGLPNLAANFARRRYAPNLIMLYEAGVIGAQPRRLPLSIGDPTLVERATAIVPMYKLFAWYLQGGGWTWASLRPPRSTGSGT